MKEGSFDEGAHVLRAKIDMSSSPNMLDARPCYIQGFEKSTP